MKFRILAVLLAAVLLCGCNGAAQESAVTTVKYVGLCYRDDGGELEQTLESKLWAAGFQVMTADSHNDQAEQNRKAEQLLIRGCDLLIVEPVMVSALDELVAMAGENDTPMLLVNYEPQMSVLESNENISFAGCDPSQLGSLQAQLVMQLPDKGDINGDGIISCMIIRGPEDHVDADLRTQSCLTALKDGGMQVDVLCQEYGDWTEDSGRAICAQKLAQYGKDVEVIFCSNDDMTLGAIVAIEERGWVVGEDFYLVGCEATDETLKLAAVGKLSGTVLTDHEALTEKILEIARLMSEGVPMDKKYYVNYIGVNSQNAAQYVQAYN